MEQPISRQQHGLIDYAYVPLVAAAPELVGFKDELTATTLTRLLSSGVLAATLLTRAEWGLLRLIPFKAHLLTDAAVSTLVMAAPWLGGFAQNVRVRNTFLTIGAFGIMAVLLTKPEEMVSKK